MRPEILQAKERCWEISGRQYPDQQLWRRRELGCEEGQHFQFLGKSGDYELKRTQLSSLQISGFCRACFCGGAALSESDTRRQGKSPQNPPPVSSKSTA